MSNRKQTIASRMTEAFVLLTNIMDESVKASLLEYGYDDQRLAEGKALYDEAQSLIEEKKQKYGQQFKATRLLYSNLKAAIDYFSEIVTLARKALDGKDDHIKDLGINKTRDRSYEGYQQESSVFYNTALANPDIMAAFNSYGITTEKLQTGLALGEALESLYADQKKKIGAAQLATVAQDYALKKLTKWCATIIQVLRIIYKADPQTLEKFGKLVYSEGYSPKKNPTQTDPVENPTESPPASETPTETPADTPPDTPTG
jgi:hypothetical protein